jgi:phosphotransferase system enzyme I (PtsP)
MPMSMNWQTRTPGAGGADFEDILETVRMFARDRGWQRRLREAVATGLTAEAAVERVQSDTRARLVRQADPYLRERLHDLDDLANRLLRILTGAREKASDNELPRDAVIVARTMGPAELLDYPRATRCAGWCWKVPVPPVTWRSWRGPWG